MNFIKEIVKQYSLLFWIGITFLIVAAMYLGIQEQNFGVQLIAEKTTQLSIMMLIIAFLYLLLDALRLNINQQKDKNETSNNNKSIDFAGALTRLLIGSFAASTIPTGISLILCAFKGEEYIKYLSGLEIYIAFAGIALISIAVLSIYEEKNKMKDQIISKPDESLNLVKNP